MSVVEYEYAGTGPVRTVRFPFADLERYIYHHYGPDPGIDNDHIDGHRLCTDGFIASHCRVDRRAVLRWRNGDCHTPPGLPYWTADRIGCHVAGHPLLIWPEYYISTIHIGHDDRYPIDQGDPTCV